MEKTTFFKTLFQFCIPMRKTAFPSKSINDPSIASKSITDVYLKMNVFWCKDTFGICETMEDEDTFGICQTMDDEDSFYTKAIFYPSVAG